MRVEQMWKLAALAAALGAGPAWAKSPDCSKVPEQYRAQCEQAAKMTGSSGSCSGLKGDARKACEQKHIDYKQAKEDCSGLSGKKKAACQQHNKTMDAVSACSGKSGAELKACVQKSAKGGAGHGGAAAQGGGEEGVDIPVNPAPSGE